MVHERCLAGRGVHALSGPPSGAGVPVPPQKWDRSTGTGQSVCGTRPAGMTPSLPFWKSSKASISSARVFITNGP